MPLLRLIGLALFITVIFLSLAAAITQTTHIRIQSPSPSVLPPPPEPNFSGEFIQIEQPTIHFTSVPIVWPLLIAAGAGLLMWFSHPVELSRSSAATAKHRKRRKR
jgi:hypothetical protein